MLEKIAKKITTDVFRKIYDHKTNIFLCGKALNDKDSIRAKIADEFKNNYFSLFQYTFMYPEDLFEELLSGNFHQDLLSLENHLAECVDAIVLVPESYGSVAELGAFSNHDELRKKLICVQNKVYRKQKSFINYGPIRLMRDLKEGKVVYIDPNDMDQAVSEIKKAITLIKSKTKKRSKKVNAINADRFLLPSIYVFDLPDFKTLRDLIKFASEVKDKQATAILTAGLSILRKKGLIERKAEGINYSAKKAVKSGEGFVLTKLGQKKFQDMNRRGRWGSYYDSKILDDIRAQVIHHSFRGKNRIQQIIY